jgi:hypothetical protein
VSLNEGYLVVRTDTGQWYFCSQEGERHVPNKTRLPSLQNIHDQESLIELLHYLGNKPWFDPVQFFQKISQLKRY